MSTILCSYCGKFTSGGTSGRICQACGMPFVTQEVLDILELAQESERVYAETLRVMPQPNIVTWTSNTTEPL
jgi:hypothetical protein